jgi:FKBP-type peptidyl-prolyl cis-trans isomerase
VRSATGTLLVLVLTSCGPKPVPPTLAPGPGASSAPAPEPSTLGIPAIPADAETTASGSRYVLRPGPRTQSPPDGDDDILVRYHLVDAEGVTVMRSSPGGDPETIEMQRLPKGWAEAMLAFAPGDRGRIWVSAELGFAEADTGPTGALFIEVELVDVVRRTTLARATLPFAAPPEGAIQTESGLAYVYLRRGTGAVKPTPRARVVAHYDGWHTDGTKFDSSYDRREPIEFELHQVIPGWTEILQQMVVGDLLRVWIPVALAYKGASGRPAGTLVFDIELLEIR